MPWILLNFLDLIASLYNQEARPNQKTPYAAQRTIEQTWNFDQKAQN